MGQLSEYIIPFVGLKEGKHVFTFEIDNAFFSDFELSPIKESDIYVHLTFEKKPDLFVLDFFIDGSFRAECDRCLEPLEVPVNGNYKLYVKFSETLENKAPEDDLDIVFIASSSTAIDISHYIYEYINISIPMQKTCDMSLIKPRECNKEIIALLKTKTTQINTETDPRWDQLKDI